MTKNQTTGVAIAVFAIIAAGALIYRQFADDGRDAMTQRAMDKEAAEAPTAETKPVPENIDGITQEIESETMIEAEAFDEESSDTEAEIQSDTQSVNDLSESYDENSL